MFGALFFLNACSDDESDAGPAPSAQFSISSESVLAEGKEVSFVNESTGGNAYLWSFGDGETAYGEDVTHTYGTPGEYKVTLEASANGKRAVATTNITIKGIDYEIYFINNDVLQVQKFTIRNPAAITTAFDLPGFSFGLAFDPGADELYFSDDDNSKVFKNHISGGGQVELASDLNSPRDIALDLPNNQIFVVERTADQVTRIDLSNGSKSPHFGVADDSNYLLPVGLDLYNNTFYSTAVDIGAETVWTADIDGSNLTNIIDYSAGGYGYAVEIDKINELIYFDDNDTGSLLRANLDGSNVETVGASSDQVYAIAINHESSKIYWVDRNGIIKEANLDGTGERILVDVDADVRGMIIRKVNQ